MLVAGKKIRAHKLILGLRSHYFKSLLKDKGNLCTLYLLIYSELKELTLDSNYELFNELIHFCYKPILSFTDKEKLNQLKDLNVKYRVIELSEMIDEKIKELSTNVNKGNANKSNANPSLGSQLQTSAAIQTEMAPGTVYLLLISQHLKNSNTFLM